MPFLVIVRLLVSLCVLFLIVTFFRAPSDQKPVRDGGATEATVEVPVVSSAVILSILLLLFVAAELRSWYYGVVARRQRETLLATAHELKSPLSALQTVGENMVGGVVSSREQMRNYGDIICRESKRLAAGVEQILSHASAKSVPQPAEVTTVERVDIPALIEAVLNSVDMEADRRRVTVSLHVAPDLPLFPGSFNLLFEALHNLFINAMQHGPPANRIVIGARQEELSGRRHLSLVVRDYGPGIDTSRLRAVFSLSGRVAQPSLGSFYQTTRLRAVFSPSGHVDRPSLGYFYRTTSEGVGLYLVRRAVRHHAGVLRLWSKGAFILFDYRETAPTSTEERPVIQVTEPFVEQPENLGCVFRLLLPYSDDNTPRLEGSYRPAREPDWALRQEDFRDAAS